MRLRIASIAFLLGALGTGLAWLTLQPLLVWLVGLARKAGPSAAADVAGRLRALPLGLALDLSLATLAAFVVLYLALGRPLRETERSIEQLARLDLDVSPGGGGGPLLSRLQKAIARMAEALRTEQSLTRKQVAELTSTNERLTRAQAELAASERLATVGKLAAGVAHEIGNPLAGVLGYLALAQEKTREPEVKDFLARIDTEVQRIDGIVRGLLDLGRPPRGTATAVDVRQLARTCADLVAAGPEFGKVELELDVAADAVARAEAGPLSQVLLNLLLNAAQATHGHGRIQLRGRCSNGEVRVEVQDSGPGIPPEVMPRLFEPFFTTKSEQHGTGLGLAISRHLVSQMGGQLQAANGPGGGALFTVVLPRA